MTPFDLGVLACRAAGFVGMATLGLGPLMPVPARVLLAVLLVLAGMPVAGAGEGGAPALVAAFLVGALGGFAVSLPIQACLAAAGLSGERLVRGGREPARAAVLLGAASWVAAGGVEAVLRAFWSLEAVAAAGPTALFSREPLALCGSLFFAAALGTLLPAFAFLLGLKLMLALSTRGLGGRPPWIPSLVTAGGVLFLCLWTDALRTGGGEALRAGVRVLTGGG